MKAGWAVICALGVLRLTAAAAITLFAASAWGSEVGHAEAGAQLDPRAVAQIERFERRWKAATTLTYRMIKRERMRDGEVVFEEALVKLLRPGRVYMKRLKPREGQEVLYDAARDPEKLVAHPGHFPDLTLRLSIEGGLATRDQHHTVADVGYQQVLDVLQRGIRRARTQPAGEQLRYLGERQLFGRTAVGVELRAGHAAGRRLRARDDESLFDFARRTGVDAYAIYMANPHIDDLTDDLDGDASYLVPAYYAHRGQIWFDTDSGLPLQVTMWDARGREYEHYEHHDLRVGVPLDPQAFSPDNPAYDF